MLACAVRQGTRRTALQRHLGREGFWRRGCGEEAAELGGCHTSSLLPPLCARVVRRARPESGWRLTLAERTRGGKQGGAASEVLHRASLRWARPPAPALRGRTGGRGAAAFDRWRGGRGAGARRERRAVYSIIIIISSSSNLGSWVRCVCCRVGQCRRARAVARARGGARVCGQLAVMRDATVRVFCILSASVCSVLSCAPKRAWLRVCASLARDGGRGRSAVPWPATGASVAKRGVRMAGRCFSFLGDQGGARDRVPWHLP